MTRFTRRASLPVALSLLTSAATAHADCAWVLWELGQVKPRTWRQITAFSGERACVDVRRLMVRERYIEQYWDAPSTYETLRCLPDTVDPRWAKGK